LLSKNVQDLLGNETLKQIATKHNVSVPQVALAWLMERNIIVLPKSTNKQRLLENFESIDVTLDEADMVAIRALNKARRTFPDPDNTDF
jgi:methylglyoxal/glyoxal reductase